jgi:hypothetical protein
VASPLFFSPEICRLPAPARATLSFQSVLVSLVNLVFTLFALWLRILRTQKLILAGTLLQTVSLPWSAGSITSTAAAWPLIRDGCGWPRFGNGVVCWVNT